MATQYMNPAAYSYGSSPASAYPGGSPGKNGGFAFRKRFERVDWRKVAAVDIDRIARTLDFHALQENVSNVTFCNIEAEMDLSMIDPNFVKLFKLAQLTIEYLLHSQEYLAGIVASVEEKGKKEAQEKAELQQKVDKLTAELAETKRESHKRKKLLMAQQQMIHSTSANYVKCPYCTKAFLGNSFLQAHITRRHGDSLISRPGSQQQQQPPASDSASMALYQELQEIRERLRQTETQLQQEKQMRRSQTGQVLDVVPTHGDENQKKEIEVVKEMFQREIREISHKYEAAEAAVTEMEARFGKRSNLGELEDDMDNEREMLVQQREEVAVLREQLQSQVKDMQDVMVNKLNKQDQKWQKKVQNMNRKHANEIKRLNDALEKSSKVMSTSGLTQTLEGRQQQQEVEEVLRKSREEQKYLEEEHRRIEEEIILSTVAASAAAASPPPRGATPVTRMSMVPSDDEDETFVSGTISPLTTGRDTQRSLGTTGSGTGEMSLRTTQFLEQLRRNPTLGIMRGDLANILQEQISKMGIVQDGITDQLLASKLTMLRTQRNALVKKFPDFLALRDYYDKKADEQAREKLRMQRRSPPLPRHPSSFGSGSLPGSGSATPQFRPSQPGLSSSAEQPRQQLAPRPGVPRPQPRAQPRPVSPQKTLQSTGSTEYTSTQWDSEDDMESDDSMARDIRPLKQTPERSVPSFQGKTPTPQPRPTSSAQPSPRPRIIQSRPLQQEDWDSDSESQSVGRMRSTAPASASATRGSASNVKQGSVAALSRSIESQLAGRKQQSKPFGGVDMTQSRKSPDAVLEDFDGDGSDWDVSPVEEEANRKRKSVKSSHDTDTSNTYKSSMWGSSSKAASTVKPEARRTSSRSSFVSVTDISSDDDLENI